MKKYFLMLSLVLLSGFTYPEKPVTRVNDYAGKLSATEQQVIIEDLKKIETATGAQVAIAIFPTIEDNSIEDVAHTLASKWKLGSKEKNDGVLLVLAMKERKMRIEVGYGLESVLTDATSSWIIRNIIRPQLKAGNVYGAMRAFAVSVQEVLTKKAEAAPAPTDTKKDDGSPLGLVLGLFGILGIGIFFITRKPKKSRASAPSPRIYHEDPPTPRRSSTRSSSSSSSTSKKKKSSSDDDSSGSSGWGSGFGGGSSGYDSGSSSSDSGFGGGGGDFGGGGSSGDW